MTSAVVVHHLTKTFGRRAHGVRDVNLRVDEGQVFGFLGPNGAGKSTTIRCILGLYRPDSGQVTTLGANPVRGNAGFLRGVGYLPGELQLPASLTGRDVLTRFARMRGLADTHLRDELVERFGAELDRRVGALSKGNKQKIGIVLAFMHRPRLLVLDEPTSGLDPLLQEEFGALLRETVADGRTVFLSSHDLDEVQRVVQRVVIVREGRIVADDTVESLRASAPMSVELGFDHDVDADRLVARPEVTVVTRTPRRLVLTCAGPPAPALREIADLAPASITARPADLDELFLRLYSADADSNGGSDEQR